MAATPPASETSDGPILNVISKRLRALKKKYNRILQMEESLVNGKTLNKEQEETFRSKPSVIAAIDELEKLRQPLSIAITEEINIAMQNENNNSSSNNNNYNNNNNEEEEEEEEEEISMIEDLVKLIYFGNMFDHVKWGNNSEVVVSTMLQRAMHERACCLNYDCMPLEDESMDVMDLLSENDLDLISKLSELLICRPVNSTLSHKNAVEKCLEHAKLWVAKSDQSISPESNATYAGLREKLNRIMSSFYFTTEPVFRVEEPVVDYGSYPVSLEETEGVVPVNATVQADTPAVQYQEKEEEHVSSPADESNEIHGRPVEELHQEESLSEQPAEPEVVGHEGGGVQNLQDTNFSDQQPVPRRSYQTYRGNHGGGGEGRGGEGRRGYSSGRGGRGRGRSNQSDRNPYYDQVGNYYQKSYNNYRGRGGRGGSTGGNYSRYASGDQAGNISAVS